MVMSELTVLSEQKCLELLRGSRYGRVALCMPDGPQIIPVNFTVTEDSVIFRTTPYSVLGSHAWQTRLALEVDQIDEESEAGWSVVVFGPGTRIDAGHELDEIVEHWNPHPWASGTRPLYVRLRWDSISGRRLGDPTDNRPPTQRER